MKFYIGALRVTIDMTQLLNGNGVTIEVNGEIRPELELSLKVSYLPISTEKLNVEIKVNQVEVKQ
jgi:hypothetical protein